MTVRVTAWKPEKLKDRFEVDIRFTRPNGGKVRNKSIIDARTEAQARKWGLAREGQLRDGSLVLGRTDEKVPTWDEFFPRFLEHCRGEREKGSSLTGKKSRHRAWLSPHLGSVPLDRITNEVVSKLWSTMSMAPGKVKGTTLSAKTVNNTKTVLLSALKLAVEWGHLDALPCKIKIPPVHDSKPEFYDFEDYARLAEGASKTGTLEHVLVRLGGDAGLRRGEIMSLRWGDCDFKRKQIRVETAAWRHSKKAAADLGSEQVVIGLPKSNKGRVVGMTDALLAALQGHRHLRGPYVLSDEGGAIVPGHVLRNRLEVAQRRAGLVMLGSLHKLRHTFCSHLAMRGASTKAIQLLAGHANITTTERYMHLSPSSLDQTIALLNRRETGEMVGETLPALSRNA